MITKIKVKPDNRNTKKAFVAIGEMQYEGVDLVFCGDFLTPNDARKLAARLSKLANEADELNTEFAKTSPEKAQAPTPESDRDNKWESEAWENKFRNPNA